MTGGVDSIATTVAVASAVVSAAFALRTLWQEAVEEEKAARDSNNMPGSRGLPMIGGTINFALGPRDFARIGFEKYGKVFRSNVMGNNIVFVSGADLVNLICTTERISSKQFPSFANLLQDFFLIQDGAEHAKQKRLVSAALTNKQLKSNIIAMPSTFDGEVSTWAKKEKVNAHLAMKKAVLKVTARILLGEGTLKDTEYDMLMGLFFDYGEGFFGVPVDLGRFSAHGRALIARQKVLDFLLEAIARRKRQGIQPDARDLLTALLTHVDEETKTKATDLEIANDALIILFASMDTTASLIISLIVTMNDYPEVLSKVRQECLQIWGSLEQFKGAGTDELYDKVGKLTYMEAVVKEVLRVRTPLQGNYRTASDDILIPGTNYIIPKGWMVCAAFNYTAMNDPDAFPEPEKFLPERFLPGGKSVHQGDFKGSLVPFAKGIHMCPGKVFAIVEAKMFLSDLCLRSDFPKIISAPKHWIDKPSLEANGLMEIKYF